MKREKVSWPVDPKWESFIHPAQVTAHLLRDDGTFPNNPKLPLLIYENVLELPEEDPAALIEELFASNHWTQSWRNGIYSFHHYHSTAHEVLGCYRGSATVQFGGEHGHTDSIMYGDVIIIPAGVAHMNFEATPDFGVVGAYPDGQHWDMCRGEPGEWDRAKERIEYVAFPTADPVYGADGPLFEWWQR